MYGSFFGISLTNSGFLDSISLLATTGWQRWGINKLFRGNFMNKGAKFHKSDFQIHSPRDLQWSGKRPRTKEDRLEYAFEFVERCRSGQLNAIAITDHHDVAFIPYFQIAAQSETLEEAMTSLDNIVPNPSAQNPVVFPGMELTLASPPCQVIVLLDADADPTIHFALIQSLNLTHLYKEEEIEGPKVSPIIGVENIGSLEERLNENQLLKQKFIIFPHVGENGHKTITRKQFQEVYKSAPCVGGYIEKDWGRLSDRSKNILNGIDPMWGRKALGVFQTSDFRGDNGNDIGCRTTWVKIAEPTAEALRQACLSRESRIHQKKPKLPNRYITYIEVSDSKFMGNFEFGLNSQLNAIIGGRGTGKSSILEYLRWAMQDQPVSWESDIGYADSVEQKRKLIQETLENEGGVVKVHWNIDGVSHVVTADSNTKEIRLQVENSEDREVTAQEIRDLLPIRAYSQKQLSSVSIRTNELQRFVEEPIRAKLNEIGDEIISRKEQIKNAYAKVIKKKQVEKDLSSCETKLLSLKERASGIEKSLPKLEEKTQKVIQQHAPNLKEKQIVELIESNLEDFFEMLQEVQGEVENLNEIFKIEDGCSQKELITDVTGKYDLFIGSALAKLKDIEDSLIPEAKDIKKTLKKWCAGFEKHMRNYEKAQQETKEHKEKIELLGEIRKEEADTRAKADKLKKKIGTSGDPENKFLAELESWIELHKQRGEALDSECSSLNQKSDGLIEAKLIKGADVESALMKLKDRLKGTRITAKNWETLREKLLSGDSTVENWKKLMFELRILAELKAEDLIDEFEPPELEIWNITVPQRRLIIEKLASDDWLEITLTSLKDMPVFYYKKGEESIPFEKASAGEQATALLEILLNESGGPLIIDQPEDDLNKEFTSRIVQQLWKAKENRQIIFASHDANLVVNGDAELIVHCDYKSESDRSRGDVKNLGAIDAFEIRQIITRVMEGGREAFELRKQKYGF